MSKDFCLYIFLNFFRVTVKLRFYPKDYVQEFMAEALSFLLRNAPDEQLQYGIIMPPYNFFTSLRNSFFGFAGMDIKGIFFPCVSVLAQLISVVSIVILLYSFKFLVWELEKFLMWSLVRTCMNK